MLCLLCPQAIQQQCSEEGGDAADGSSEGEEGDSLEEEDDKDKLKGDQTGSKRKKTATFKVLCSSSEHTREDHFNSSTDAPMRLDHEGYHS